MHRFRSSRIVSNRLTRLAYVVVGLSAAAVLAPGIARASDAPIAPAILRAGQNLGAEDPSTTPLRLTVWLNLHDREALDARVQAIYTPGSPSFHKWLTDADLMHYLPTSTEIATVRKELASHNLTVLSVDPYNLSVRLAGRTSDVERAFHTQVSRYSMHGSLVRTSSTAPALSGAAASLVRGVGGLNSLDPHPYLARALNPQTDQPANQPFAAQRVSSALANGLVYASQCFYAPSTVTVTGGTRVGGTGFAQATISGLVYGANPTNTADGTLAPCGYSPAEVQSFYGLDEAYGLGYTGAGQTIVLIDAYLEPTAKPDADVFNQLNHLPTFTSANFAVYNPYGANQLGAPNGWDQETDLDVQWAHATAPGANIALVQAFSQDWEDLQAALLYAITNHLGNVISNSYGLAESEVGTFVAQNFNLIAELGAAQGVSVHVASGDYGDFTGGANNQDPTPDQEVSVPSDAPYVTSVGGTTIGTDPATGEVYHLGWGNNINGFRSGSLVPLINTSPATTGYFVFGSGGGVSSFFPKPNYQSRLPGAGRLQPDISALADPYTGAEFVFTNANNGNQYVGAIGGTSLASPIFSGIWAVVDEYFGGTLGQAAPYLGLLPSPIIRDIVPVQGPANVTESLTTKGVTTNYSAAQISSPLENNTTFVSAWWNTDNEYGFPSVYNNLSFGTDSGLTVTQGWDDVTGYGTPDLRAALTLLGARPKQ